MPRSPRRRLWRTWKRGSFVRDRPPKLSLVEPLNCEEEEEPTEGPDDGPAGPAPTDPGRPA